MAVTYKGLTIKFGGDTTELQAALKRVQSSARETQSDLKAINRSLKLDPGSTVLLEQKVRSLNSAYAQTESKLAAYRQALAQLEAKKSSGVALTEREQRQYDSLQRAILGCEHDLEGYGKQLKSATGEADASRTRLYRLGQTIEDNSGKIGKIGDVTAKAGAASSAAFGGMAAAAYASFDKLEAGQNAAVRATGAIGDAAEATRRSVTEVASQAPGDFETVGSAVGQVAVHFKATGSALVGLSTQFLKFSKVTGADVSSAVEGVAKSMKAFGVDSSQTSDVLDMLTEVSTSTGVSVDTLMGSLNSSGSTFREMGLSIQDSAALLGDFEAAGVPADQMLTGLKRASANCAKSGTDLSSTLQGLVRDLQDPATQAKATQQAIGLFGTRAAMSFVDAAKTGRVNLSDLGGSLDASRGKVSSLKDETTTAGDKIAGGVKQMTIAGASLGESFAPFVETAAQAITRFAGFIRDLSPEQRDLVVKVIEGGVAFGAIATAVGKTVKVFAGIGGGIKTVAGTMGALKGAVGLVGGAWSGLTALIAANPIGLGIAAVAAAVAGLTWFFTQTETGKRMWADFTGFLTSAWESVKGFFAGIPAFWGGVWDSVRGKVDEVGGALASKWDEIRTGASDAWEGIRSTATGAWENLKSGAAGAFGAIADSIGSDLRTGQAVGSAASAALRAALNGDWRTAGSQAASAFNLIKSSIGEKMQAARSAAVDVAGRIGSALGFPGLAGAVSRVFDGVGRFIQDPIGSAWNFISGIPGRIMSVFSGIRISLPHVNLPHFRVRWNTFGPVQLPSVGIDWYAKGGIFDRPSVIGVGEAGREAVVPIDRLSDLMASALDKAKGGRSQTVSVSVSVEASISGDADAYATGRQIGLGIASRLKQRGVRVAT